MELRLPADLDRSDGFIRQIIAIDSLVYPKELRGTFESVSERFHRNRDSYILAMNRGTVVGYLCFFPISPELRERMDAENSLFDDDIDPDQILPYGAVNDLFLISAAIRPAWQDGGAVRLLSEGFRTFLRKKGNDGFRIASLRCHVISEDGARLAGRFGMERAHGTDGPFGLYRADGKSVNRFCQAARRASTEGCPFSLPSGDDSRNSG